MYTRRELLKHGLTSAALLSVAPFCFGRQTDAKPKGNMKLGLVTYNWGADWDLPTLLENCKKAGLSSIELRVEHKHNVSPKLSSEERKKVAAQFKESGIELVGFGTNFEFHSPDVEKVRKNIEGAKEYVLFSKDCGASGIKVKPNDLPKGVEKEKTIAQIAAAMNELSQFAGEHGQEIRLEVHGGCAPIPIMKGIMDQISEKSVGLCWNCNKQDLDAPGLKENFESVRTRLGKTVHIRDLASKSYPTKELFDMLREIGYDGHLLIEEGDTKLSTEERLARLTASAATFAEWSK